MRSAARLQIMARRLSWSRMFMVIPMMGSRGEPLHPRGKEGSRLGAYEDEGDSVRCEQGGDVAERRVGVALGEVVAVEPSDGCGVHARGGEVEVEAPREGEGDALHVDSKGLIRKGKPLRSRGTKGRGLVVGDVDDLLHFARVVQPADVDCGPFRADGGFPEMGSGAGEMAVDPFAVPVAVGGEVEAESGHGVVRWWIRKANPSCMRNEGMR